MDHGPMGHPLAIDCPTLPGFSLAGLPVPISLAAVENVDIQKVWNRQKSPKDNKLGLKHSLGP